MASAEHRVRAAGSARYTSGMLEIRYLDELVDELARGKVMERSSARREPAAQLLADPEASPGR